MKRILVLLPLILLVPLVLFLYRQIPNDKTPSNTVKEASVSQNQNQNQGPQKVIGQVKAAEVTIPYSTTNPTNEVKVKNNNYQISFSKDSQNPTSAETRYSRLANGVKEEIILSKAPTTPFIAKYTATLSGVKPRFFKDLWHFFDEEGKEQFFIPKPFMIDQKNQRSENINLQISPISGTRYQITLTPDHSWLTSPGRTYPLIIDPSVEVPGQPIQEIISKRNQNSKTYLLPNSNFAWEGQIGPIHYKDNPDNPQEPWKEIDTRIQPVTDPSLGYSFQNLTNNFKSFFKKNSYDPATVRYEDNGSYITFTNQDNELGALRSVEGYAEGNRFIYPDAYDNIDIKYSIGTSELLEEFVLKGPRDVSKISQRVHFEDAKYQKQDDGTIKFLSTKTNEPVWTFPKPKMYEVNERPDKDGLPSRFENFGLHYEITKDGNDYIVTKVLDQAGKDWLNSPERVYPLVIDTTVDKQTAASADDAYIDNTPVFTPSSTLAYIGKGGFPAYAIYHTFARWIGVTIEGTINVSYVQLYAEEAGTGSPLMKVYGVDEDNPAAPTTYAEFVADPLTTAAVDWDDAFTINTWEQSPSLNTIFQELVDTYIISNEAVMVQIKNDGGDGQYNRIRQWDYAGNLHGPKLHIEYTAATPTPTPTPTPPQVNLKGGINLKGGTKLGK